MTKLLRKSAWRTVTVSSGTQYCPPSTASLETDPATAFLYWRADATQLAKRGTRMPVLRQNLAGMKIRILDVWGTQMGDANGGTQIANRKFLNHPLNQ